MNDRESLVEHGGRSFEIGGRDIRALTARIAHPNDPLAAWKADFGIWKDALRDFRAFEDERLFRVETPSPYVLRLHRWLLHSLMGVGEQLALSLLENNHVDEEARAKHLSYVDGFLGGLEDAWATWHREANPAHKEMLAKFLS